METTIETTMETFDWDKYEYDEFYDKLDALREAYDRAVVKFVNTASKRGSDTKIVVKRGFAYVRNRKRGKAAKLTYDEVLDLLEIKERYTDIVDLFNSYGMKMNLKHLGVTLRLWDTYSLEEYDETFWYVF
jgi:hypothetical protein